MNYCERINAKEGKIKEFQSLVKKETKKLHAYIKFQDKYLHAYIVNFITYEQGECVFKDYSVENVKKLSNEDVNALISVWNKFLSANFEDYKKAYHDYYFKNVDVDILKKDNTQEK